MMVGNRKIGVLFGGLSGERDVSVRTGEAILHALHSKGYDASGIFVDRDLDRLRVVDQIHRGRIMTLASKQIDVLGNMFGGQGTANVPNWSPDGRKIAFVTYQLIN